ncbi:unnamed protein product, partial [Arctia plantaginis]
MMGIRTPIKGIKPTNSKQSPTLSGQASGQALPPQERDDVKVPEMRPISERRSIGEWESGKPTEAPMKMTTSPKKAVSVEPSEPKKSTRTLSQDSKTGTSTNIEARRTSMEVTGSPPTQKKYADRMTEARACVTKAKILLGKSKNIKTEIKTEVTQAIDRLFQLVKEADSVKGQGVKKPSEPKKDRESRKEKEAEKKPQKEQRTEEKELLRRIDEHTRLIEESNEKMERLRETIEKHQETQEKMTYASVAATTPRRQPPERAALHSIVVTAKDETETGDEIMKRIREVRKELATHEIMLIASEKRMAFALIQEPYVGAIGRMKSYGGARIFQNTSQGDGTIKAAIAVFDEEME